MTRNTKNRLAAALAAVLAAGFTGSALADRDHGWDGRHDRYERNYRDNDGRYDGRRDYRRDYRRDQRYDYAPRYDHRYRAPAPRGWYPGWREPYGRGYRYWNDNYYYVVPSQPSLNLSFVLPLR